MNESIIEQLAEKWKFDTSEKDWENRLKEKYKRSRHFTYFSYSIGLIILVSSMIIMVIALFAEGSVIFGKEVNSQTFYTSLLITTSSSLFLKVGLAKLQEERLKTLLYLKESIKQKN